MQMSAPIVACQIPVVCGTDENAFWPGPIVCVVGEDVVRYLEHRECRDARGEAREPHQRQADEERERRPDAGGKRERRDVPDVGVDEEVREPRHDRASSGRAAR